MIVIVTVESLQDSQNVEQLLNCPENVQSYCGIPIDVKNTLLVVRDFEETLDAGTSAREGPSSERKKLESTFYYDNVVDDTPSRFIIARMLCMVNVLGH